MKKESKILSSIVAGIVMMSSFVVGNILVEYAISRKGGGGNRHVKRYQEKLNVNKPNYVNSQENEAILIEAAKSWRSNLNFEKIEIMSYDDLTLRGEMCIQNNNQHKYVILVHGYRNVRQKMDVFALEYWKRGYHILFVDLRSHGESDGKYLGMGWMDRLDLLEWIKWLSVRDKNSKIVLHGISMGAATVMMVLGEPLPPQVKVCIEDSGFTSAWDMFCEELRLRFHLPPFPIMYIASLIARKKAGYWFKSASSVKQLARSHTPTLFIHGTADEFVPFWMLDEVYKAAKYKKECYVVEGAKHVKAIMHDPEQYNRRVFGFIDKHISN